MKNYREAVFYLTETIGVNIELKDKFANNVLHLCASNGFIILIVYFVQSRGMTIKVNDFKGRSLLHIAALEE